MGTTAEFPIHVRTDARSVASDHDAIARSLERAVGGALRAARHHLPAGGAPNVVAPTFRWVGEWSGSVAPAERQALETACRAAIRRALHPADAGEVPPQPLGDRPIERIDDSRHLGPLDAYIVDSYGGGQEVVPTQGDPPALPAIGERYTWRVAKSEKEMWDVLQMYLDKYQITDSEMAGVIALQPNGSLGMVLRPVVGGRAVKHKGIVEIQAPVRPKVTGAGKHAVVTYEPVDLNANDAYELHYKFAVADSDARIKVITEHYGPSLKAMLIEHGTKKSLAVDQADINAQIDGKVKTFATAVEKRFSTATHVFELKVGGRQYLLFANGDFSQFSGSLFRYFSSEFVVVGPPKEGEGTGGGGRGAGAPGGAGDGGGDSGEGGDGDGRAAAPPPPPELRLWRRTVGKGTCEPFFGEPSLTQLGPAAAPLQSLIARICAMLQIRDCGYAAWFSIGAAGTLEARAVDVREAAGHRIGAAQSPSDLSGPLFEFQSTASPAIQALRHLAAVVPLISELSGEINSAYLEYAKTHRWPDPDVDMITWLAEYHSALLRPMRRAVGTMFVAACRAILTDQLESSYRGICDRLDPQRFPAYAAFFRSLVVGRMSELARLTTLHTALRDEVGDGIVSDAARSVFGSWQDAHRALSDVTEGYETVPDEAAEGLVTQRGDTWVVWDGTRDWTMQELEGELAFQRKLIFDIDPLAAQIDAEQLMERFRADPKAITRSLKELLVEMRTANREIAIKVTADPDFAFTASRIRGVGGAQATVPGTSYALAGIHAEAHRQIGQFFGGDIFYAFGIQALFGGEETFSGIVTFIEWTAVITLSIICPPLGVGLGVVLAGYHLHEAHVRMDVQRALLSPELVGSRAEAEVELFASELGLALSIIPEAGTILRGVSSAGKSVVREGLIEGTTLALRATQRALLAAVEKQLAQGLERVIIREVLTDRVMDLVVTSALTPVIEAMAKEAQFQRSIDGSPAGPPQTVPPPSAGAAAPAEDIRMDLPPGGLPDAGAPDGGAP